MKMSYIALATDQNKFVFHLIFIFYFSLISNVFVVLVNDNNPAVNTDVTKNMAFLQ